MNTNQVGQSMSRERNEHSVESEMEGIRKGYIYIYIYKRHSGTGTTQTGTGTTRAKRGRSHLVSVPHLLVPVPLSAHGPI